MASRCGDAASCFSREDELLLCESCIIRMRWGRAFGACSKPLCVSELLVSMELSVCRSMPIDCKSLLTCDLLGLLSDLRARLLPCDGLTACLLSSRYSFLPWKYGTDIVVPPDRPCPSSLFTQQRRCNMAVNNIRDLCENDRGKWQRQILQQIDIVPL